MSTIPKSWLRDLLTRSWFRGCLSRGPAPIKEKGKKRCSEIVMGPPPRPVFYSMVSKMARDVDLFVARWKGVRCVPYSATIDRSRVSSHLAQKPLTTHIVPKTSRWSFLWPKAVWDFIPKSVLVARGDRYRKWIEDHPFLHIEKSFHSRVRGLAKSTFSPILVDFVHYSDGFYREA